MWARFKSQFSKVPNVWSMLSILLGFICTGEIIRLAITKGGWGTLPADAFEIQLEPLQALALVLALTALLVAVTARVANKFEDIGRNLRLVQFIRQDTATIVQRAVGGSRSENTCSTVSDRDRVPWLDRVRTTLRSVFHKVYQLRVWLLFSYALLYSYLRLNWAASYFSFDHQEFEIVGVRVDVTAAIFATFAWSLIVIMVTERMVHLGRQLETDSEALLWAVKAMNTDARQSKGDLQP